jgi:hypothetical protein
MKPPKIIVLGNYLPPHKNWTMPQRGMVYDPEGIAPTCDTCAGGGSETKIIVYEDIEDSPSNEARIH